MNTLTKWADAHSDNLGVDLRRAYGASGPDHLPTVAEAVANRMTELVGQTIA